MEPVEGNIGSFWRVSLIFVLQWFKSYEDQCRVPFFILIVTMCIFVQEIILHVTALVKKIVKDKRGRLTMNVMGRLSKGESFGVRYQCIYIN